MFIEKKSSLQYLFSNTIELKGQIEVELEGEPMYVQVKVVTKAIEKIRKVRGHNSLHREEIPKKIEKESYGPNQLIVCWILID